MTERTPCPKNPHGDFCCWHWRGRPPTPQTIVQADCCWCGGYHTFGYEAILDGSAPITPSGSLHGSAHVAKVMEPVVTYTLGRLSPKTAARAHAQTVAQRLEDERHADHMGIRGLASIVARQQDTVEHHRAETVSAERRIEDALTHFAIGRAAADAPVYVDWQYVAEQMAAALRPDRSEPA